MTKRILTGAFALAFSASMIAGCASKSEKIEAAYVSTVSYEQYSCEQLALEAQRVSQRAAIVSGAQDEQAKKDAVAVGVSLVLFWPAVFFVKGDSTKAAELSRLKGEMNAIEQVSTQKNCGFVFDRGQGQQQAQPQVVPPTSG